MNMGTHDPWYRHADHSRPGHVGVIAEVGVNHDGSVDHGLSLIESAAEAGADAVKLQMFSPDRLLSKGAGLATYQRDAAGDARSLLKGLTLGSKAMMQLGDRARALGLKLIVTPFSPGEIETLSDLGVDTVKIASPDAVNTPLLEAVAGLNKPILVSTGTCELGELEPAASLLKNHTPGGALLQCVSSYPTPTEAAALNGIAVLSERFGLPVGYSDHTQAVVTGALAAAAGAVLLEKHITYDRQAQGPDHAASADPAQFAEYVRRVRQAETMLGPRSKSLQEVECDVRKVSRQSVAITGDRPAGHTLSRADLTVMRPGTGIPAKDLKSLVGHTLARPVPANTLLSYDDLVAQGTTGAA